MDIEWVLKSIISCDEKFNIYRQGEFDFGPFLSEYGRDTFQNGVQVREELNGRVEPGGESEDWKSSLGPTSWYLFFLIGECYRVGLCAAMRSVGSYIKAHKSKISA